MAIRPAPARELRMDIVLREKGIDEEGIRAYVRRRIRVRGEKPEDIASDLRVLTGEPLSHWTLYAWLTRWNAEEKAAKEAAIA